MVCPILVKSQRKIEIPSKKGHICVVRREKGDHFTARGLGEFLEDLLPFLSFTFGKDIRPSVAIGYGETTPMTKWGVINSGMTVSYRGENWYSISSSQTDLSPIFPAVLRTI